MKRFVLSILILTFSVFFADSSFGQETPSSGFRAEFLKQLDAVSEKIVELAEAVPAEKYSWRPSEGVRSISEVYVHIAAGNYFLMKFMGIQPPADFNRDMEKNITEKAQVIAAIKKSVEHLRQAALKTSDADLEKSVELFGQNTTYRDVFFTATMHLHEHLGQSIAYARMNGVVPPWSASN
ncbi:DinB family protein [bacterium]|nr:DinB family protein [bacterium]MCI0603108.1 DinB family protein [bacterium]